MNRNEPPISAASEQKSTDQLTKRLAALVPRYKNFFIEQEILQRQGFDSKTSRENIARTRKNLTSGFRYLQENAMTQDENFLAEEKLYAALENSRLGILPEEAVLFKLITTSLTIQHASPVDVLPGESIKSIRHREISGEKVTNQRTGNMYGRQNFVYFVTGVGDQINAPGLQDLNIYQIHLNKLALHNPQKFSQLHVSPHLSEFVDNACANPFFLASTRIDIQFDNSDKSITYRFQRSDNCVLQRKYFLDDFVFYGGNDVVTGIALRFIELLRFVGNPYRNRLLEQVSDPDVSPEDKLKQLSLMMTMLMPGSMVLEAKIPAEIQFNEAYAKKSNGALSTDSTGFFLVRHLEQYALEFYKYAEINIKGVSRERLMADFSFMISRIMGEKIWFSGESISFSGHIASDLNALLNKLILSEHDLSLKLIEWLVKTKIVDPIHDEQLGYLANINERETTGSQDLICHSISVSHIEGRTEKLLEIFFPFLSETRLKHNFCYYVAAAAHQSRGEISTSKIVRFFLEKNIAITDVNNVYLVEWVKFSDNVLLLDYMFKQQKLDINAVVHGYSWLEHALLEENAEAVDWLKKHGAVLHRRHPDVVKAMQKSSDEEMSLPEVIRQAVVIMVTSVDGEGCLRTIMGRRRVGCALESQWSFPGGIVDHDEKPVDAAIRELEEETSVKIDKEKVSIREVLRVDLQQDHQTNNTINQLIFIHIDLGNTLLPAVWPGDDLGDVTKVKVRYCNSGESVILHKSLPIRLSNMEFFEYLIRQQSEKSSVCLPDADSLSSLLYAEWRPSVFIQKQLNVLCNIERALAGESILYYSNEVEEVQGDKEKLIILKNDTALMLRDFLQKISHIVDEDTKAEIVLRVINLGDVSLLGFIEANHFSLDACKSNYAFSLDKLIDGKCWEMLRVVFERVPQFFHLDAYRWEDIRGKLDVVPQDIAESIRFANADRIIFNRLNFIVERCVSTVGRNNALNEIKSILLKKPDALDVATEYEYEKFIKLIILTGDIELFRRFYQNARVADKLDNAYFYVVSLGFGFGLQSVDVLNDLYKNGRRDMLIFLYQHFPQVFKYSMHYLPDGYSNAQAHDLPVKNKPKQSGSVDRFGVFKYDSDGFSSDSDSDPGSAYGLGRHYKL